MSKILTPSKLFKKYIQQQNVKNIPDYGQWHESRPKRIEIPLDAPSNTRVKSKIIADIGIEAPRMNYYACNGKIILIYDLFK